MDAIKIHVYTKKTYKGLVSRLWHRTRYKVKLYAPYFYTLWGACTPSNYTNPVVDAEQVTSSHAARDEAIDKKIEPALCMAKSYPGYKRKENALLRAVKRGQVDLVVLLLDTGMRIEQYIPPALQETAKNYHRHHVSIFTLLLTKIPVDINKQDKAGYTLLNKVLCYASQAISLASYGNKTIIRKIEGYIQIALLLINYQATIRTIDEQMIRQLEKKRCPQIEKIKQMQAYQLRDVKKKVSFW